MIYCFDLDGTLCITEGSDYINSVPIQERIDRVNGLFESGHIIWIDSARGSTSGKNYLDMTQKQLSIWGIKFHKLRTGVKFNADVFIDDKGILDISFFEEVS